MNRPTRHPKGVRWGAAVGLVLCTSLAAGCAEERDPPPDPVTWLEDIQPLVEAQCVSCHSGEEPAGNYDLTSYQGALGDGTDDVPNAVAGRTDSRILTIFGSAQHQEFLAGGDQELLAQRRELLRRWVVDWELAYFYSAFHGTGIQNPRSPDFHGELVEELGWGMETCRECHGDDYAGGVFVRRVVNQCVDCHPETPEACDTCHGMGELGAPPPTLEPGNAPGAHLAHLEADQAYPAIQCSACHLVPEQLGSPGHIDNSDDGQAEVIFQGLSLAMGATPSYELGSQSCGGTYCHAFYVGGEEPSPVWTGELESGCSSCHGFPPPTTVDGDPHPESQLCAVCHLTANLEGEVVLADQHVDGEVQIREGIGTGACDPCHASPDDPVPFYDANGRTDPTLVSVGEHNGHAGPSFFHQEQNGEIGYQCSVCHPVPAQVDSPGHLNTVTEVVFDGAAVGPATSNLQPEYNREEATCSNIWCHGAALSGGSDVTPPWNEPDNQVVCGTCHGIPPETLHTGGNHPPAQTCGGCHGNVIDDLFQWVDVSLHANGEVNLGGAP